MTMNMKSSSSCLYVFFLLIFLLLVDKSHSGSFSFTSIFKADHIKDVHEITKKVYEFNDLRKNINQGQTVLSPPPPQPNASPSDIEMKGTVLSPSPLPNASPSDIERKGLNFIKRYLSEFAFLNSSAPYSDIFDADTKTAIKSYQQFFNFPFTGLNKQTLQSMSVQRCWVPDDNFDAGSNLPSWPKATNPWFPKSKRILSYFLGSEIPPNANDVFRNAFARWAEATTVLKLTETKNSDDADIIVDFYIFNSSLVWVGVVGGAFIKLKSSDSNEKIGGLALDANWNWVPPADGVQLSWEEGVLDLETVVMHQIGHLLGLDHSNKTDSVMYPAILPERQRKVELSDDDKDAILKYYTNSGHQGGPFKLFGPSWGVLTTLLWLLVFSDLN